MDELNEMKKISDVKEFLELTKLELTKPKEEKHLYGLWSKKQEGDTIIYQRNCKRCGHSSEISTSVADLDIERVIQKQLEASKYTNFFCNSSANELTNENVLLFLAGTIDYQPYMDIDKIIDKIIEVNNGYTTHNTFEENLIFNAVLSLQKIRDIPEELFNTICNYLNKIAKEREISANKEEIEVINFAYNHFTK